MKFRKLLILLTWDFFKKKKILKYKLVNKVHNIEKS